MRYDPIDNSLFINNRRRLAAAMPDGAVAVFHSNDIYPTNADGTMPFVQNSNLFWLTGINQEETVLIMFPNAPEPVQREILFIKQTNQHIATWEGYKYSKEEATAVSGIDNIMWTSSFNGILKKLLSETTSICLPSAYHAKQNIDVPDRNQRFTHWCQEHFPLHTYTDISPMLHELRRTKSPIEIELIRRACRITEAGFRRVLEFVRPGVYEYEIEAEYAHEFLRRGARGFAYEPIVASGENSCVLHYIANERRVREGEVLLMDVGACYANYNADMSRTIPVSGRFSNRQRQVYEAVLRCLQGAKAHLKAGSTPAEYNAAVQDIVTKELVDLGLVTTGDIRNQDADNKVVKKYFMHKTAHAIGLDVHDVGDRHAPYRPGQVFTCEPGIYIREEHLGVRLENDILITEDGNIDLMASIPIEPEDIENLMNA